MEQAAHQQAIRNLLTQEMNRESRVFSTKPGTNYERQLETPRGQSGRQSLNRMPDQADYLNAVQRAGLDAGSGIGTGTHMRAIIEQLNSPKPVSSDGLVVTFERLADLFVVEEEEGFPSPTKHAYQQTTHLLKDAHKHLRGAFPRATVSVEEHGGLFAYWIKPSCTVQLTVPSSPGRLFYIRVMKNGAPSQVYQDVTGERLAKCLQTFNLMH